MRANAGKAGARPRGAWNPALLVGQWVHAQIGQRYPLRVKQAEHVVVGPHQQGNGIGVRFVAGKHRGVDVAVRRNEREPSDLLVKRSGYLAHRRFDREEAVWVRERSLPAIFHYRHRSR